MSVTDRGTIGWWDMDQLEGWGVGPQNTTNFLWAGGFWGGNGRTYVCNRDYVPTDPTEWEPVPDGAGRLAPGNPGLADQHYTGLFQDSGHDDAKGVRQGVEFLREVNLTGKTKVNGTFDSNNFVWINTFVWFFAEEFFNLFLYFRHTSLTAN